ncbi:hypothetical protein BJ742DRAFT_845328 [Cladochytrium replicatum]|nr:hypothetical protein BJ742DRAFT_845328 [Cladochytrium replicatum]
MESHSQREERHYNDEEDPQGGVAIPLNDLSSAGANEDRGAVPDDEIDEWLRPTDVTAIPNPTTQPPIQIRPPWDLMRLYDEPSRLSFLTSSTGTNSSSVVVHPEEALVLVSETESSQWSPFSSRNADPTNSVQTQRSRIRVRIAAQIERQKQVRKLVWFSTVFAVLGFATLIVVTVYYTVRGGQGLS